MAQAHVTIATVTFNSLPYTQLFLQFLDQYADEPFQLIIVDNHSTDGTPQFLQQYQAHHSHTQLILNQRNLGFAQANNQAFRLCRTEYFLGLNNDTVIFPGFLHQLLQTADKYPKYGEFGVHSNCIGARDPRTDQDMTKLLPKPVFTGTTTNPADQLQVLHSQLVSYYGNFAEFFSAFYHQNPELTETEVPINFIGGWCFLVRTTAAQESGGLFDRQFKIGFWEDVDLSWRLAQHGFQVGLINNIYLHHYVHASFNNRKLKLKDSTISRRNALYFAEKWSDTIRQFLQTKLNSGMTLEQITQKYFISAAFIGKQRSDWAELENKLQQYFLSNPQVNFRQFLELNRKQQRYQAKQS